MGITSQIQGFVRGAARRVLLGSSLPQYLDVNAGGDLMVAQGLPDLTSIVSMGGSWATQILTADAVVPVAVIPTTAANLQLYNNAPLGSNIQVVIDSVFAICKTSSGAADFYSLLGQIVGPAVAAAPSPYASIVSSLNGKGINYNGVVLRGLSVTTALANQWFSLGNSVASGALTATVGLTLDVPVRGKIVI